MRIYKYVSLKINNFFGAGNEEHRDIIDRHGSEGYRYVGFIPTSLNDHGKIKVIDLIFEKDQDE